jgi:hypothetical protein
MPPDEQLPPSAFAVGDDPTKEELFRQRFLALVAEVSEPGAVDQSTLTAIGTVARRMMDDAKVKQWATFKRSQTRQLYDATLRIFEKQGNAMMREKKLRTAFAIQVLAMSLIARTQTGPEVQAADRQLDAIIDFAANQPLPRPGAAN